MDLIGLQRETAWSAPLERRVCLLVLGMHRSGTSALARVLSIAGAELPEDIIGASAANKTGHWESNKLCEYHDRMLAEFDTAWDDWRAIDFSKVAPARRIEIKAELSEILMEQFGGGSPLIVVKDPRICRFAPLFFDALGDAGFEYRCVLPFRSPLDVMDSLGRRDQMPRGQAGLLWLRHVLDAELATSDKPRALISYSSLLSDWETRLAQLGEQISVSWPYTAAEIRDQVNAFLSPVHDETTVEETVLDPISRGWLGEVYSAMLVLEKNPGSAAALATIDRVRRELNGAEPAIGRLLSDAERRHAAHIQENARGLSEARRSAEEAKAVLMAAREECAELAANMERRNEAMEKLSAEIVKARDANVQLAIGMANQENAISRQQAELAQMHVALQSGEAEVAISREALTDVAALRATLQDREAELAKAMEALAAYERPSFRAGIVRQFALWLFDGEVNTETVDCEKFIDWLAASFQNQGDAESWCINPRGAELVELAKLLTAEREVETELAPGERPPARRLLLVSEYAPSFAHAGGLRLRDLYVEIKRIRPDLNISLYCPIAPDIDGDISWLGEIFDDVHLTSPGRFSFIDFIHKAGGSRYDVVDCQFHKAGRMLSQFSRMAGRTLFTPMECLSRATYEQVRSDLRKANAVRVRDIVALIRSTLDEVRIVSTADETVCVSGADACFLQKLAPWRRIDSMATGLSESEFADQLAVDFRPRPPSAKPKRLVYAAYFGSNTNRVGLAWFLDHVHPHILRHCSEYKLAVVGRGDLSAFIEQKPENVTFIGEVPVMPPVLEQARAGLALALNGSGFRGKINQYAVCGLPSISTNLGITGLAYTAGVDIVTADDPDDFALACIRMLMDDEYADQLAANARTTALDNYRWNRSHEKIRQIYRL